MYDLALFLFILNVSMAIVNNMNVVPSVSMTANNTYMTGIKEIGKNTTMDISQSYNKVTIGETNWFLQGAFMILEALKTVVEVFGNATVLFPYMLYGFGFPSSVVLPLTSVVWIIYGIGIVQLKFGKGFKDME